MTKKLLFLAVLLIGSIYSFAQKGQIWPTQTRQEFDIDKEGNITKEYESTDYNSYYLFINNNEFIHCTGTITSLYKIVKRTEKKGAMEYTTVSEVGNTYKMTFNEAEKHIILTSIDRGYSIYLTCLKPYQTEVFDNINR
ncbi:hypothetical protein [Taibaiella sp. KBW10]|uniref:hypothetical protein n=1 Tax=Taibaiella sp. KBW10 TaxID=2153357 RepID=UPI000F59FB08|nr:hypothetical protein [Taibaiella sp. KBW10]